MLEGTMPCFGKRALSGTMLTEGHVEFLPRLPRNRSYARAFPPWTILCKELRRCTVLLYRTYHSSNTKFVFVRKYASRPRHSEFN